MRTPRVSNLLPYLLSVSVLAVYGFHGNLAFAEKLSMVSYPPTSQALNIGQKIDISFKLKYADIEPGTSIYIIPSALDGDKVILEQNNKIGADKPRLSFCGSFVSRDNGPFAIVDRDQPISTSFNYKDLFKMLEGKYPKEQLEKFSSSIKSDKLKLTFGFLATLDKREGIVSGRIGLTVPDLPYYYDGLLLTPYLFRFDKKGSLCARYDGRTMHSIKYPVTPNRVRTAVKKKASPFAVKGNVELVGYSPFPTELVIGNPNRLRLNIQYSNLGADSHVYVFLNTVHNDEMVHEGRKMSVNKLTFTTCKSAKLGGGVFNLPASNKPIRVQVPFLGAMEAAHVASLPKGGSGRVSGTITFTPPLLTSFYNGVRLTAVVYQWNDKGERCTRFSGSGKHSVTVPLLGR